MFLINTVAREKKRTTTTKENIFFEIYFKKSSHPILKTGHLIVTMPSRKIPTNFFTFGDLEKSDGTEPRGVSAPDCSVHSKNTFKCITESRDKLSLANICTLHFL